MGTTAPAITHLRGVVMTERTEPSNQPGIEQQTGLRHAYAVSRRQVLAGAGGVAAAAALAACGGSDTQGSTSTSTTGAEGTPKPGGDFHIGVTGGGSKDIMDGQNIVTKPDQARLLTAFETLLVFDEEYQLQTDGLAEEVTYDNPTQYTIKLKDGI